MRLLAGNYICLNVKPSDKIETIKKKIQDRAEIPFKKQRLACAGRLLEDGKTIFDYNIDSLSCLDLNLRLLSCKHRCDHRTFVRNENANFREIP